MDSRTHGFFRGFPSWTKFGSIEMEICKDTCNPVKVSFFFGLQSAELYVTFLVNCWPSSSNDGTCEVSIEYELENENITLYDITISIPFRTYLWSYLYFILFLRIPLDIHIQMSGLLILLRNRCLGQSKLSLHIMTASLARCQMGLCRGLLVCDCN